MEIKVSVGGVTRLRLWLRWSTCFEESPDQEGLPACPPERSPSFHQVWRWDE